KRDWSSDVCSSDLARRQVRLTSWKTFLISKTKIGQESDTMFDITRMNLMWISFYSLGAMALAAVLIYVARYVVKNRFLGIIISMVAWVLLIAHFLLLIPVLVGITHALHQVNHAHDSHSTYGRVPVSGIRKSRKPGAGGLPGRNGAECS